MYDAIVIGGGPGGYVSAIRLSQLKKKVALIEKENLGGTCTNWGCIPTKAMLTSTHLYNEIKTKSKKMGIKADNVDYDIDGIMKHMNKAINSSRKGIEFLLKKNNIDFFRSKAEILDKNKVKVDDDILETKNIILAHGSQPLIFSPFDQIEGIWTSDDVFKMSKIPNSILIIGGGVIGLEFSTFFASLGVKVILVELYDHILPYEDEDIALEIKKVLKKKGVNILEKQKVSNLTKNGDFFVSTIDGDSNNIEIETEKVLLAVGRKPVIPEDVKKLGVKIEKGILTDKKMKTNIDGVYAIGDVRAQIMLAHVASFEGIVAAHNIAGEDMDMDYSSVPSIIFTNPEIASTGLKEKDVDLNNVIISKFPVSANGRARTMEEKDGFAKIISDKQNGRILGFSIVSPSATDMIMEGVIAVKYGLTVEQLANSIHPHPTLTETILGAVEGSEGMAIHL